MGTSGRTVFIRFSVFSSYGDGLPSGTWLATLTRCELKKGLQDYDRRNTFKNHGKVSSDGFYGKIGGDFGGPGLIFDSK